MRRIKLTQGKYAIVDDDYYDLLNEVRWQYSKGYATRTCNWLSPKVVYMHRVIAGTPRGKYTDHINGDKLDNRESNLRTCTYQQNNRARHKVWGKYKYRGVYKRGGRWYAYIRLHGRLTHIGAYPTIELAAKAYNEIAIKHFGRFIQLNKVKKG